MSMMAHALRHKIRVLCLHGYRTNVTVMAAPTQVLVDAAEFEFLNDPFEVHGPTDPVIEKFFGDTAPLREWFRVPIIGKRDVGPGSDSELNTDPAHALVGALLAQTLRAAVEARDLRRRHARHESTLPVAL